MFCQRMQSFLWKSNNLEKNANVLSENAKFLVEKQSFGKNANVLSENAKFLVEKQ